MNFIKGFTIAVAVVTGFACAASDWSAARAEWNALRKSFKADYSDGADLLLPPAGNRFEKPFAVTGADGKPACRIVYATGRYYDIAIANETTKKAAEELQHAIRRVTGVEIPVNPSDPALAELPAICIGKGMLFPWGTGKHSRFKDRASADLFDDDLEFLHGTDGYAIRTFNGNLHVYGESEKGALNGVYALMENNTDIIYVRPCDAKGVVFTPRPDGLSFVWGEGARSRPASVYRGFFHLVEHRYWNANYVSESYPPWTEKGPWTRGAHNVNYYAGGHPGVFAEKSTFETNPEFYGMVNGKRDRVYGNMLCFSNPEMKKTFIRNVLTEAGRWRSLGISGINFSLDDSMNWCECAACSAPLALPDGTTLKRDDPAFMSTCYFLFVNEVARALEREFPGMKIRTLAYFQTAEVPKCDIEKNIEIQYCPYMRVNDSTPVFFPENEKWIDRARRWYELTGRKLKMYGYNALGLRFPQPLSHVHQRDFREYFRYMRGINAEFSANYPDDMGLPPEKSKFITQVFDYSAIEFWVMSRLYWDPEEDVERLYKKFCYRAFREAAKPMERFYGAIREEWMRSDAPSTIGETGMNATKTLIIESGREKEMRGYLEAALSAVRHPVAKVLVGRVKFRFEEMVEKVKNQRRSEIIVPQITGEKPGWDSPAWKDAAVIDTFYVLPKAEKPARVQSTVRLYHDGRRLYVKGTFPEDLSRSRAVKQTKPETVIAGGFEVFFGHPVRLDDYRLFQIDSAGNIADYKVADSSWNRKKSEISVRTVEGGWETLMSMALDEIGCDLIADNRVLAAFIRIRESRAVTAGEKDDVEYSSWRWSWFHQPATFGVMTLQR